MSEHVAEPESAMSARLAEPRRSAFTGLVVHHDPAFDYTLLVPDGWQRLALSGSPSGVFYAPDPDDLLTGLAIEATRLGTPVRPADRSALRAGLLAGLRTLPSSHVELHTAEAVADLITLEARVTFGEAEAIRKRWVRLLYRGSTQLRLVAQAASVETFAYWEPMFFEAMRTVHFGRAW